MLFRSDQEERLSPVAKKIGDLEKRLQFEQQRNGEQTISYNNQQDLLERLKTQVKSLEEEKTSLIASKTNLEERYNKLDFENGKLSDQLKIIVSKDRIGESNLSRLVGHKQEDKDLKSVLNRFAEEKEFKVIFRELISVTLNSGLFADSEIARRYDPYIKDSIRLGLLRADFLNDRILYVSTDLGRKVFFEVT